MTYFSVLKHCGLRYGLQTWNCLCTFFFVHPLFRLFLVNCYQLHVPRLLPKKPFFKSSHLLSVVLGIYNFGTPWVSRWVKGMHVFMWLGVLRALCWPMCVLTKLNYPEEECVPYGHAKLFYKIMKYCNWYIKTYNKL